MHTLLAPDCIPRDRAQPTEPPTIESSMSSMGSAAGEAVACLVEYRREALVCWQMAGAVGLLHAPSGYRTGLGHGWAASHSPCGSWAATVVSATAIVPSIAGVVGRVRAPSGYRTGLGTDGSPRLRCAVAGQRRWSSARALAPSTIGTGQTHARPVRMPDRAGPGWAASAPDWA